MMAWPPTRRKAMLAVMRVSCSCDKPHRPVYRPIDPLDDAPWEAAHSSKRSGDRTLSGTRCSRSR
jgi:hypothetical protein